MDAHRSVLVTAVMAARLALVMASLVLNGFADLYYARFRPELREYVNSASSRRSTAVLKHKTNRPAATTNEIELNERERCADSTRAGSAALLEAAAAEGGTMSASSESSPRANTSVFTFAGSSKHKRMSPEVFASFLSRAIYFWPWGYPFIYLHSNSSSNF